MGLCDRGIIWNLTVTWICWGGGENPDHLYFGNDLGRPGSTYRGLPSAISLCCGISSWFFPLLFPSPLSASQDQSWSFSEEPLVLRPAWLWAYYWQFIFWGCGRSSKHLFHSFQVPGGEPALCVPRHTYIKGLVQFLFGHMLFHFLEVQKLWAFFDLVR